MDHAMKQSTRQLHRIFFHISKFLAFNAEKNITVEDAVDKNCFVVFSTSGFPYLTLYPRQCKWKVATTYLAIRAKNN